MERSFPIWGCHSRSAGGHNYLRRVRALGLWGFYRAWSLVPVLMASRVGVSVHHCQGTAIVVSVVWGHNWRGCTIRCDNTAVVAIIQSGSSRDPTAMHLMRCLFFFTARFQIVLAPAHINFKLKVKMNKMLIYGFQWG